MKSAACPLHHVGSVLLHCQPCSMLRACLPYQLIVRVLAVSSQWKGDKLTMQDAAVVAIVTQAGAAPVARLATS